MALAAYERAPDAEAAGDCCAGGHFDAYEAEFDRTAGAETDWFREHLREIEDIAWRSGRRTAGWMYRA